MFCKECGKSISDDSKFCSYCGSKVEPIESSDRSEPSVAETIDSNRNFENGYRAETVLASGLGTGDIAAGASTSGEYDRGGKDNRKKINLKRTANFSWDLDGFPSEGNKKEKKVNIEWDDVLMQEKKDKRSNAEDKHFADGTSGSKNSGKFSFRGESTYGAEDCSVVTGESDADDDLHRMIFGYGANESRPEEDNSFVSGDNANINSTDSNRVNKFYTFNKKNEEFQRLLDREYEKLKLDANYENIEDNDTEIPPSSKSFEDKDVEIEKKMFPGEGGKPGSNGSDLGRKLQTAGEGTPRDDETNLELLEQEGEHEGFLGDDTEVEKKSISAAVASGSGESMGGIASSVAAGGAAALSTVGEGELGFSNIAGSDESAGAGDSGTQESGNQIEPAAEGAEVEASLGELAGGGVPGEASKGRRRRGRADNRKKTKFNFQAIFDDEDTVSGSDNGEPLQTGDENTETALKEDKISDEDISREVLTDSEEVKEEKAEEPSDRSNDENKKTNIEPEEEEIKPKSKAFHALSILFYTILVIVIVILGIKIIAPNSSLAIKIDRTYDSIIHMITGQNSTSNPVENPEETKTVDDWIADSASANQNIGKVQSDPELKVDITNKDFKGVDVSKPFSDSTWYTEDGSNIYYGPNIVKTVIAYFSDVNSVEGGVNGEKVETLNIGEIRTGEFGFFVATSVSGKKGTVHKYTVYVEPEGTSMKVSDVTAAAKSE